MAQAQLLGLPNPKIGDGKVKLDIKVKGKKPNPFASGSLGGALVGAAGSVVGGLGKSLISGGLSSDVGEGVANIGGQLGGAISAVNPLLGGIVSAGSGLIGGGINALFGMKTNEALLNRANSNINAMTNFTSDATTTDDLQGVQSVANVGQVYEGGVFSGGEADRKNKELQDRLDSAVLMANRNVLNNANNIESNQINDALANYSAFGGFLGDGTGMGAIDYDFMTDYLSQKKRENDMKSKMNGIVPIPAFMPNSYAIGGDLQTNGADWSDGLVTIGAGGSHETNPNEGIQLGVDSENVPNLVEENETIYKDYVFSARIPIDATTKELFHIGKKREMTYADLSKKLEKEIAERVNDPISRSGFEKQMQMLEEQQERQKQEMEAERAKAAFEALSPEEQTALMQQRAEQEALAQQQAMVEPQVAMQQPSPEEVAMMQQQQMADGSGAALGQEPEMNCFGGKINKFEKGGAKKVGTWKDPKRNHWDIFTKPGLQKYIEEAKARITMAPDDETKEAIRKEIMNDFNTLQQSYFDNVLPTVGSDTYEYNDNVLNHQQRFDKMYGNTGFYSTDDSGNVRNLIAEAINIPEGASTSDKPESWADGYNGLRTSIRNFGSTEYGTDDYYKQLADAWSDLGFTYAPNENWTYGDNKLYGLSLQKTEAEEKSNPKVWDWNKGDWTDKPDTQTVASDKTDTTGKDSDVQPVHRNGNLRYAGLFGPAVGLGMQMAGIGRPDTGAIDTAIEGTGNVTTARWKPLGNYLTYRPLDVWYAQNAMNAQSRATDRQLMNTSGGNRGAVMAGLLSNGYNSQIASGNLFRQAQEYNDNLRKQVEDFNRGTNQFNSEQFGRTSQFNADAYNRARQANAQLRLQAAAQKADMDAGWNQGIYGNVAGLFKGISDLGRENEQFNWLSDLAADGAFGNLGKSNTGRRWTKDKKAKGGKMKKKGLTI